MRERLSDDRIKEIANGDPAFLSVRLARELVDIRADIERLATAINANQHRLVVPRLTDEPSGVMRAIDVAIEVIEGRQATCDRLNAAAFLQAIREPSTAMVDAAAWFESPSHGPRSNAGVWRAMIDALIEECKR